ncbi:MAG: hypothetical protein RL204_2354 [Bacteroidota bacterium]|jgi:hypothetical protein
MRVLLFLICLFLLPVHEALAQDKILLMNGKEMECRIVADSGYVIVYDITKRNGKVKQVISNRGEVFSYTQLDSDEVIVYSQDTTFGDIYNASEMRAFLAGQADSRNNFKARHIALIGFASCATIAFLGKDGYFTAVGPPVVYTVIQLIGKVKIREKTMSNKNYKYNDIYADGYEPPARTRKIITAFSSGMIGSAVGLAVYFITK